MTIRIVGWVLVAWAIGSLVLGALYVALACMRVAHYLADMENDERAEAENRAMLYEMEEWRQAVARSNGGHYDRSR